MDPSSLDISAHIVRRQRLLGALDESIAIIPTSRECYRNRDTLYPYRPDSYFWYLTGFPEPDAVLVLNGKNGHDQAQSILFCRDKNIECETWDGFRFGPEAAQQAFGVDAAYSIDELEQQLPLLVEGKRVLFYPLGADSGWDERIFKAIAQARKQIRDAKAPKALCDIRNLLDPMRRIKDEQEIALMKKAAAITAAGHQRAMSSCRPGIHEFQLEAELAHEFRRRGADGHAYPPIVASGQNGCVLHYVANGKILRDGDLVLIDAGCEYRSYASDITRTFPVNGRFSAAQAAVYEIVLEAQRAAIETIRPGVLFTDVHDAALRVLVEGLVYLKLLEGSIDSLIESNAYQRFYMHRTSHWLGLDVHDAGEYKSNGGSVKLEPGMIMTVEPGLYIRAADDIPKELHDIGIRIEDDALVVENGCEIYTQAPKSIRDIEALMNDKDFSRGL